MSKVEFIRDGEGPSYDYKVLIDGVHLATFDGRPGRRGYSLYDVEHEPVSPAVSWSHQGLTVDTKAEFEPTIQAMIDAGTFPTFESLAARHTEWEARKARNRQAFVAREIKWVTARHAEALFQAARTYINSPVDERLGDLVTLIADLGAERAEVEAKAIADFNGENGDPVIETQLERDVLRGKVDFNR